MLSVENLKKCFDGFWAVKNVSLKVEKGQIVAVIGPNGAGKTTLFNLICGQIKPDGGRVTFKGHDITGLAPYKVCRLRISRSYQVVNIFHRLTVFENVQIAVLARHAKTSKLFGPARKMMVEKTSEILKSVGLLDMAGMVSGNLSHGDQKVLEIAIALGNDPELLIMDEPTAGMSMEETSRILNLMERLSRKMGLTILFCEHDMGLVFALSDEIMVMQQGESIIQDSPDVVRNDQRVKKAYLGEGAAC